MQVILSELREIQTISVNTIFSIQKSAATAALILGRKSSAINHFPKGKNSRCSQIEPNGQLSCTCVPEVMANTKDT